MLLRVLSVLGLFVLAACSNPVNQPPVASAPIIGVTAGVFTLNGGSFEIAVAPLDARGNLISSGVTVNNFAFTDVRAATVARPTTTLTTASVQATKVNIIAKGQDLPLSLVLDFDSSGSMQTTDPERLRVVAGKQLVAVLDGNDQAAILDFSTSRRTSGFRGSRLLQPFTSDKTLLNAAIDKVESSGGTPLYASVLDSLDVLGTTTNPNKAVVLLTDGVPDGDSATFTNALTQAQAQSVPIFTIGLGTSIDFTQLQRLAQQTGGTFAEANDAAALTAVFSNIGVGVSQGRVIVIGEGQFSQALSPSNDYIISGTLVTTIGGNSVSTPFSFRVSL
jgi:Ca-activated chloride channel homolog